jgi:DNA-binding winged helix-turn-helix (wHTH) protein
MQTQPSRYYIENRPMVSTERKPPRIIQPHEQVLPNVDREHHADLLAKLEVDLATQLDENEELEERWEQQQDRLRELRAIYRQHSKLLAQLRDLESKLELSRQENTRMRDALTTQSLYAVQGASSLLEGERPNTIYGCHVHWDRGALERDGLEVRLSPREVRMLEALALAPIGNTLDNELMSSFVWGPTRGSRNRLRVLVARLREKIDPLGLTVEGVHGYGFRLVQGPRGRRMPKLRDTNGRYTRVQDVQGETV